MTWANTGGNLPITNYHIIVGNKWFCESVTLYYTISGVPYRASTLDGGYNWNIHQIPMTQFVDAEKRYGSSLVGHNDKTTLDSNTIFVCGNPLNGRWGLAITTDNGQTFDTTGLYLPQNGSEFGFRYSLDMKGNYVWFGTSNSHIYRGYMLSNWVTLSTPGMNSSWSMWFIDSLRGMVGGESGILYTTDGGNSFTSLSIGGSGNVTGICSDGGANFWAARGTDIWFSSNSGTSWNNVYTAPAGTYNYLTIDSARHHLVGIRNNGGVTIGISTIGIRQISSKLPASFELEQNYPNPFNPSTTIKFQLPKQSYVTIKVYNILGKEIATLANNEKRDAGYYEVIFDGTSYASGVYYYQINAESEGQKFTKSMKMVLVK